MFPSWINRQIDVAFTGMLAGCLRELMNMGLDRYRGGIAARDLVEIKRKK